MSFHLDTDKLVDLDRAAATVADGALVALGGGLSARLPMALVRELIRQHRRDLHVVGSAHGIDVDLLIAAGAIAVCEESYVGFEQDFGLAPAYRRAAETGAVEVRESCCATVLAQLRAAEFGLPFMPVRGVKGSDIRRLHPEYREMTCPATWTGTSPGHRPRTPTARWSVRTASPPSAGGPHRPPRGRSCSHDL